MKTDFSISVQVNLGVTPELVALVSAVLAHNPQKLEGALTTQGAQLENAPQEQKPEPPQQKEEEAAASQAPTTKRGRKKKDPEPPTEKPKDKPGSEEEEAAANRAEANADGSQEQQTDEQSPQQESEAKQEEAAKPLTEEDVRAAMHRTRQRIEGEDYKDNPTSEQYQKYHKPLTAQFKNIAALLGSDKPSALSEDKREAFIKQCEELKIMKDGTIGSDCPF